MGSEAGEMRVRRLQPAVVADGRQHALGDALGTLADAAHLTIVESMRVELSTRLVVRESTAPPRALS